MGLPGLIILYQINAGRASGTRSPQCHPGDAKLIWATTTPVRERSDLQKFGERTERVKARNRIAAKIMKEHDILINDLFGLVEQHPDWHSTDGVHFNGKGKDAQAKQVSESVAKYLPARTGDDN